MKRSWVIHQFLVATFPILLLDSRNYQAVPFRDVSTSLALILGTTLVLWLVLRWVLRDSSKAGLIVSSGLILFFSFGRCVRIAERLGLGSRSTSEWLFLAFEGALMGALVVLVVKKSSPPRWLTSACNAGSFALVGISLSGILGQAAGDFDRPRPRLASRLLPLTASRPDRLPDIYFLVLDAYGRSDVLEEIYGFDNSAFLDRLEQKGFTVARRSTANYCQTALSVSATLEMAYHDDLAGSRSEDRQPLKDRVADNRLFRVLKSHGYRFASFATGFNATNLAEVEFYDAPPWNLTDFHALLADTTPLWLMLGIREDREPHRLHRRRILNVFDRLPEVARIDGPTFCLAHVVAPHPPFVFGPEGEDRSTLEKEYTLADGLTWSTLKSHGDPGDYASRYRDQVTYVTRRIEQAIDRILTQSPEPPVIILQGDHGPASQFDTNAEQPNDLRERMGILNACYLPGESKASLGPTITPVNTFRVVLDRYFGSKLGLLEDRNYYSAYETPYVFTDVTSELKDEAPALDPSTDH